MDKHSESSAGKTTTEEAIWSLKKKLLVANKILESEKMATPFGHVSVRIPGTDTFLITRSISPGAATMDDFLICDREGKIIRGNFNDTYSEVVIHTGVYNTRREFNSVVHSHSLYVIGLSLAGATVLPANLQMTVVGPEPVAVYDRMVFIDKPELGVEVARLLGPNKAVILKGHGAVVVGETIEGAIYAALTLERSAMYQWMARSVGKVEPVSEEEKRLLTEYHGGLKREGHGPYREWAYYEWKLKDQL